jgi:hypothetical protein
MQIIEEAMIQSEMDRDKTKHKRGISLLDSWAEIDNNKE